MARQTEGDDDQIEPGRCQIEDSRSQKAESKANLVKRRPKRDRSGENFKKRWGTLTKMLRELHYDYGAEFQLSLSRKRQGYVCQSRKGIVPMLADDVVRAPSPLHCFTTKKEKKRVYISLLRS